MRVFNCQLSIFNCSISSLPFLDQGIPFPYNRPLVALVEVVVYSKYGCHLCEEVKTQLGKLRAHYPFELREVNIVQDAQLYEKYKDEIPVVFINGRKAFKYRLDEKEFLRRLQMILMVARKIENGA